MVEESERMGMSAQPFSLIQGPTRIIYIWPLVNTRQSKAKSTRNTAGYCRCLLCDVNVDCQCTSFCLSFLCVCVTFFFFFFLFLSALVLLFPLPSFNSAHTRCATTIVGPNAAPAFRAPHLLLVGLELS